jgi:hypothetical protein
MGTVIDVNNNSKEQMRRIRLWKPVFSGAARALFIATARGHNVGLL